MLNISHEKNEYVACSLLYNIASRQVELPFILAVGAE